MLEDSLSYHVHKQPQAVARWPQETGQRVCNDLSDPRGGREGFCGCDEKRSNHSMQNGVLSKQADQHSSQ